MYLKVYSIVESIPFLRLLLKWSSLNITTAVAKCITSIVVFCVPPLFFAGIYLTTNYNHSLSGWYLFALGAILVLTLGILTFNLVSIIIKYSSNHFTLFLLIGFFAVAIPFLFATAYHILNTGIDGRCIINTSENSDTFDPLYFSYTTLTTLGYGDVQPIGLCRIFTSLQAVIGYIGLGAVTGFVFQFFSDRNLHKERKKTKFSASRSALSRKK